MCFLNPCVTNTPEEKLMEGFAAYSSNHRSVTAKLLACRALTKQKSGGLEFVIGLVFKVWYQKEGITRSLFKPGGGGKSLQASLICCMTEKNH